VTGSEPLRWSREPPKEAGWWWVQWAGVDPQPAAIVEVIGKGAYLYAGEAGYLTEAVWANHRWAGPIPPPEPPL
jgi:hypothetical protein